MENASLQLDHVALTIRDVEASRRFYGDVLRMPLVEALAGEDWGGFPWLMMIFALADGRRLALCAFAGAPPPLPEPLPKEARHFAFGVRAEAELAVWQSRLRAASVPFWEEKHGAQRSLYFEDPNGIVLELTTPPTPDAGAVDRGAPEIVTRWLEALKSR